MVSHYPIRRGSEWTLLAAAAAAAASTSSTSTHLTSNEHSFYPAALCLQHKTHWAGFERCFFLQSAYEQPSDRSPLLRLVLLRDRTQLNGRHSLLSDSPHRFLPTVHSLSCHCFTQKLIVLLPLPLGFVLPSSTLVRGIFTRFVSYSAIAASVFFVLDDCRRMGRWLVSCFCFLSRP